jgi:metal-responsive CopG/Arc/MetJ family transcriptional regulator
MKTAISVPDRIFARVENAAKRLGISRSEFFARAAERWADQLDQDDLTDRINAALEPGRDENADFVGEAASRTLLKEAP